jgi:hypothetical protein
MAASAGKIGVMRDVEELDSPIESRQTLHPYGEQDENGIDLSLIRAAAPPDPA